MRSGLISKKRTQYLSGRIERGYVRADVGTKRKARDRGYRQAGATVRGIRTAAYPSQGETRGAWPEMLGGTMRHSLQARFTPARCIGEVRRRELGSVPSAARRSGRCGLLRQLVDAELPDMTRRFCGGGDGDAGRLLRECGAGRLPRTTLIGARTTVSWRSSIHPHCGHASGDGFEFSRQCRFVRRVGSAGRIRGRPCAERNHHA